jgi:hypothetical protein
MNLVKQNLRLEDHDLGWAKMKVFSIVILGKSNKSQPKSLKLVLPSLTHYVFMKHHFYNTKYN